MDSTLIQQECIDEIAKHANVQDQVSLITNLAMNGKLDFKQSLIERVKLLKNTPTCVLEHVKQKITFTPGARELIKILQMLGYKTAVISGGFMPLANYVKNELNLDHAFANNLKTTDDGLYFTGELSGDIVDSQRKADFLLVLSQFYNLLPDQVIAVGDGANDVPMLKLAGLGIAFNAKPSVQEQIPCRINLPSLLNVLYFLGFDQEQINAFSAI